MVGRGARRHLTNRHGFFRYSLNILFVKVMNVEKRPYRLGKRQDLAERTRASILRAAHDEVSAGAALSVGRVARKAGVSRITVYNQFGSKDGLLDALRPRLPDVEQQAGGDARTELRERISRACSAWASHASLIRHLPKTDQEEESGPSRRLAERLAAADALRPGCSIKEAEDVIGALTSFEVFDRLYNDGRRSAAAVAEILLRLTAGILSDR